MHIFKKIFFLVFGVKFNGDCAIYDRHVWLKKNLVVLNENSNLLDVGCGNGWALLLAKKIGFKKIIGFSWDEGELKKNVDRLNSINNIELKIADAKALGEIVFNTKFDAIVNCENIEHIINAEKLINDISKLLNNGGLLFLTTPNILYKGIYGDGFIKNPPLENGGHVVRGYSKERLEKIFSSYNLKIISLDYIGGICSRKLLSIQRIFPFLILKILYIPLTILCNFFDNLFFQSNKNNLSIAIVAEKIE